jgi:hypothetical protein
MMAAVDFKATATRASDPRVQEFFSVIEGMAPKTKEFKNVARDEQPFLPDLVWAFFSAYTLIVGGSFIRLQALKIGVSDSDKLLKADATKRILKAVLPHHSKFIDEHEPETYYFLLEEIERSLLSELRRVLEGKEADRADAARAKEIMDTVRDVEAERAQQIAVNVSQAD